METIPLVSYWTKERLISRRKEIGESAFDRGYRQKAIVEGELLFRNFERCVRYDEQMPVHQFTWAGVDLSSEKRKGTVITVVAMSNGIKYPIEIRSGAWSSPETAENILSIYERWRPQTIYVENNAYQQALIDWCQTKGYITMPIEPYTTGKQKSDAQIGLPSLDVKFEHGQWAFYLPRHDVGCSCDWCVFYRQMKYYPTFDRDDFVMSFWFAERASDRNIGTFSDYDALGGGGSIYNKNF